MLLMCFSYCNVVLHGIYAGRKFGLRIGALQN